MKRFYTLLTLIFISTPLFADPFYADDELNEQEPSSQLESQENIRRSLPDNRPICSELTHSQAVTLPIDFTKIKLIGLVKIDNQFNALFIDEQKQLISLKENDFIPNSNVLITQINLKDVQYWQYPQGNINDCETPQALSIKL
ncbi:hypothetical protein BMT54_11815 [Pasteurellaceae bacterium 15-036681]|nr:hypothetical protein BMT54_11815 [Pasteurellaceae bacterium 15-036681]